MTTKLLKAPKHWMSETIKIVLVGFGGTGSEVFDILSMMHLALQARGGKGLSVTAYDPSIVRTPNIVRQRFWPCDIGQYKSVCLANRYNLLLGTNWSGIPSEFPMKQTNDGKMILDEESGLNGFDILISATDLPSARSKMSKLNLDFDAYWLDFGNGQDFGQAILGLLSKIKKDKKKDIKYPHVLDHYPQFHTMPDNTKKSCSVAESLLTQDVLINRSVACAGMNLLWRLIKQGETEINGCVVNLSSSKVSAIGFS